MRRLLFLVIVFFLVCAPSYQQWEVVSICPVDQPAVVPIEIAAPSVLTPSGLPVYVPMDINIIAVYQDAKDMPLTIATEERMYPGERRRVEVVIPRYGQCWLLLLAWNNCGPAPLSQPSDKLWIREAKGFTVIARKR